MHRGGEMPHGQLLIGHQSKIPLTIVAGGADAGKTSLVRHLVTQSSGSRVAALVAPEARIDPPFVARRDGSRIVLQNGSLWIPAEDDGAATLATLAEGVFQPEHVVYDSTASVDLRRAGGFGYMPGYRLDGLVFVTDPARVRAAEADERAEWHLRGQTTTADVVVLNKADSVDERTARNAQFVLERLAPQTRIVWTEHGRIAPPLLLGLTDTPDAIDGHTVVAEWSADYVPAVTRRGRATQASTAERARLNASHRAWCLMAEQGIDARQFRQWVQHLPAGVLSGRGTVFLRDEPEHRHLFHFLGRRWRLERGQPWGNATPATRVLLAAVEGM